MDEKLKIFLAALPALLLLPLLIATFLRICFRRSRPHPTSAAASTGGEIRTQRETFQSGITKLHLPQSDGGAPPQRANYYVIRRGVLAEPLFRWSDHPRLITEAVENGWARFAFAAPSPALARSKSVWELCAVCDYGGGEAEVSWEISSESVDCMQKIRLDPRPRKRSVGCGAPPEFGFVRMELPLPGPHLGNLSFPQEAYFEIIIVDGGNDGSGAGNGRVSAGEGEQVKLISEAEMKIQSDSLVHSASAKACEGECGSKQRIGKSNVVEGIGLISLGLTGGGFPTFRLPGTYTGSIGFNSDGSLYLDGIKLVFEANDANWRGTKKVIGCGFDPGQKWVFFTVDSKLVHVINCKPKEFGSPLYPVLASNTSVTMLVNLGQTPFKYGPANLHRTPNPCFLRALPDNSSPTLRMGYEEDSRELFSMGRIDSKWLGSRNKNGYTSDGNTTIDVNHEDGVSDIDDLFEIVLDDRGKSQ